MTRASGIRRCRCRRRHRTYRTFAKCIYRRAASVTGAGPYALLSRCGGFTVTLYGRRERADTDRGRRCGEWCVGRHRVVVLRLPALDPQEVLL